MSKILIFIGVIAISWSQLEARDGDYLSQIMPPDIKIGDSGVKIEGSRITVRRQSPAAGDKNYELVEKYSKNTLGWYYIRNGNLSGYMRTSRFLANDIALNRQEVDRILPAKGSGFVRQADESVSRIGSGLERIAVNAVRWQNFDSGLSLYTVLTEGEVTVVIFDPAIMASSEFFMKPDSGSGGPSKLTHSLTKVEAASAGRSSKTGIIFVIVSALILVLLIIAAKRWRQAKLRRNM